MIVNRLRVYDPDFKDVQMPDIDLKALEQKRDTHIVKDKFGDTHISQKRDGITQIITLDKYELELVLDALKRLEEK